MSEVKSDSFNWKGEGGDKFAKVNPSSVEGTDAHFIDYFKVSVSDLFREVEQVLLEKGNQTAGLCFVSFVGARIRGLGFDSGSIMPFFERLSFSFPLDKDNYNMVSNPMFVSRRTQGGIVQRKFCVTRPAATGLNPGFVKIFLPYCLICG